jgi:hypothetical protein
LKNTNYKFHNPEAAYFVSFAVVEWIDVFSTNECKDIFLKSHSQQNAELNMDIYTHAPGLAR